MRAYEGIEVLGERDVQVPVDGGEVARGGPAERDGGGGHGPEREERDGGQGPDLVPALPEEHRLRAAGRASGHGDLGRWHRRRGAVGWHGLHPGVGGGGGDWRAGLREGEDPW